MAYFMQSSIVNYACSCGLLKPITKIYFCRHCLKVRCGYCVCHEVDSHYCANCLENIPSSEARLRKNRCASCFDCPCCFHTLSTRATIVILPGASKDESKEKDTKPITRKMYYFACLSCRWTSRDVGIPDQTVATGAWPERDNVFANRVAVLQDYFNSVAIREKQEKQENNRKKFTTRGKYTSVTDKTGLTASMIRKQVGLSDISGSSMPQSSPKTVPPALAVEHFDELPANIFTKPLNLKNVTTLAQRLIQPENQASSTNKLFPQHKILQIKQSLRCRVCEHNVIKPEYNPGSIKFKIHLFAYYHVPEVRFVTCEPLRAGQPADLIIKVSNPTANETTITILPLSYEAEEGFTKSDPKSISTEPESLSSALSRQASVTFTEDPRPVDCAVTSEMILPEDGLSIVLPHRDDAAEYGDEIHDYKDPKYVVWRRSSKAGLKIPVKPHENLKIGDDVLVGFTLKYTYINTVSIQPEKHELHTQVYILLGKCQGTN